MEEKRRVIALAFDGNKRHPHNASQSIVKGIFSWGKQNDWEFIDLGPWLWNVPGGVTIDGLIYNLDLKGLPKLERLVNDIPCNVRITPPHKSVFRAGVRIDSTAIGLQAANYYINRGFRSFAIGAYHTSNWWASLKVFKQRVEEHGGQCAVIQGMHLANRELEDVRKDVRKQLRNLPRPLGIFCMNDRLAVRLCHWCLEEGIAVPEQAAILGFGNDTIACCSNRVPLSSINQPLEQMGMESARLLQRMMDGEPLDPGTLVSVPPQGIVTRRSTDITAISDERAAKALRYIWDYYADDIGADDIADFCGMTRRSLDRHFLKALGRTVSKEITRQRLKRACDLLVGSDEPASRLSARVGFKTPQYFNYQFKKHFACTPQEYRERERKRR